MLRCRNAPARPEPHHGETPGRGSTQAAPARRSPPWETPGPPAGARQEPRRRTYPAPRRGRRRAALRQQVRPDQSVTARGNDSEPGPRSEVLRPGPGRTPPAARRLEWLGRDPARRHLRLAVDGDPESTRGSGGQPPPPPVSTAAAAAAAAALGTALDIRADLARAGRRLGRAGGTVLSGVEGNCGARSGGRGGRRAGPPLPAERPLGDLTLPPPLPPPRPPNPQWTRI